MYSSTALSSGSGLPLPWEPGPISRNFSLFRLSASSSLSLLQSVWSDEPSSVSLSTGCSPPRRYLSASTLPSRWSSGLTMAISPSLPGTSPRSSATALAMWLALYPLFGNRARNLTLMLGIAWTLLMSLAVVGAHWHTPLDAVGSILLSVGFVTAGAAILEPIGARGLFMGPERARVRGPGGRVAPGPHQLLANGPRTAMTGDMMWHGDPESSPRRGGISRCTVASIARGFISLDSSDRPHRRGGAPVV